jgi:hypothetical protein
MNFSERHWGLTFFYAYRAYGQESALNQSLVLYHAAAQSFISPQDAISGSGAGRNISFSLPSNCAEGNYPSRVILFISITQES